MNLSEEKHAEILAKLAKVRRDINRIQANGVMNSIPEMEQLFIELQDLLDNLSFLTEQ